MEYKSMSEDKKEVKFWWKWWKDTTGYIQLKGKNVTYCVVRKQIVFLTKKRTKLGWRFWEEFYVRVDKYLYGMFSNIEWEVREQQSNGLEQKTVI